MFNQNSTRIFPGAAKKMVTKKIDKSRGGGTKYSLEKKKPFWVRAKGM